MSFPARVEWSVRFSVGHLKAKGKGVNLEEAIENLHRDVHRVNPEAEVLGTLVIATEVANLIDAWVEE